MLDLSAVAKESLTVSKTFLDKDRYTLSRTAFYLRPQGLRGDFWKIEADLQMIYYQGDYLKSSEWRQILSPLFKGKSAVEWEIAPKKTLDHELRGRVYRFYGSFNHGGWEMFLGRMRNAFGNTRIFLSPLDYFDDLPIPVSEPNERPGSDTAGLKWRAGESSAVKAAYLWSGRNNEYRSFVHAQHLVKEGLEAGMILGQTGPRTQGLGAHVEYSVFEGELGWEGMYHDKEEEKYSVEMIGFVPQIKQETVHRRFTRHLTRWERAYGGDWVFAAEYYHNGLGEKRTENYNLLRLLAGEDLHLGRDYAGANLSKTLTPLWSGLVQGVSNLKDGGFAWYPELKYLSPSSFMEAKLRASYFAGSRYSEYGRLPDRAQLLLNLYF
ncbi:MAG: hypothetical protein HY747_11875 [Elusimicrobia bacterium]|nr:hypothetical protein [Elusimicrobiota bacterium]